MTTFNIPNDLPCHQILPFIEQLIRYGAKSIEVDVYSFGSDRLVICTNINVAESFKSEEELIYLEDLLALIQKQKKPVEVVLNLQEDSLENRVKVLVEEWGLKKQVKYSGAVNPAYLTPWDRPSIYYNIENCLPNVYQLGPLKRTHFDVIDYFCKKHRIQIIRLHGSLFSKDLLCWANTVDLKLSIFGIKNLAEAKRLKEEGVTHVAISDVLICHEKIANQS